MQRRQPNFRLFLFFLFLLMSGVFQVRHPSLLNVGWILQTVVVAGRGSCSDSNNVDASDAFDDGDGGVFFAVDVVRFCSSSFL